MSSISSFVNCLLGSIKTSTYFSTSPIIILSVESKYGTGKGRTKKAAEQQAAYESILILKKQVDIAGVKCI